MNEKYGVTVKEACQLLHRAKELNVAIVGVWSVLAQLHMHVRICLVVNAYLSTAVTVPIHQINTYALIGTILAKCMQSIECTTVHFSV